MRMALVMLVAWVSVANAQPGGEPAPAPPPPPDPKVFYDAGFGHLLTNNFEGARAQFEIVVQDVRSEPEMRGAARELIRLIDELTTRHAMITFGNVPDAGMAVVTPLP